jgi:phosphopantothenoylcysteine decarboxylase/phosphopantothenate--cysteine ligase
MALIALGVTGGIGAYKAVEVCRGLQRAGHEVVAVMTESATRFVGPLTFEAITHRPVVTSLWTEGANADIEHVALADQIDLLLVAPCTANAVGKFANGIADDFLSSLYLATRAPILLAPAMNSNMLAHGAVRRNLDTLAARGVGFVEPGEGYLACGWIGKGRLAEPAEIVEAAGAALERPSSALQGRHVLVTAGPTYEDLDPVRFLGNRSSGRMGFALAAEALRRGARVTLVAGPSSVPPPGGPVVVRVRSASEMRAVVMAYVSEVDVVIMAAAVADYRPVTQHDNKLAKTDGLLTLTLERTPDILAELGQLPERLERGAPLLVGFAAETRELLVRAREKRDRKRVDVIVANEVGLADRGFEAETNAVTILDDAGELDVPVQSKAQVAVAVFDRIEHHLVVSSVAAPQP